jgi:MinD superfamily P-loop ATPase
MIANVIIWMMMPAPSRCTGIESSLAGTDRAISVPTPQELGLNDQTYLLLVVEAMDCQDVCITCQSLAVARLDRHSGRR